jgi:ferredoxin
MIYEKEKRYVIAFDDVPAERQIIPALPEEERKLNFIEVETGFTEEQARMEAGRCLSCRRCLGCALCWAECKPVAIDFDLPDESRSLEFEEVVLTSGQDNGFHPVKPDLGYGKLANVVTDLQFEQMLSPHGPTGGIPMAPGSGDTPAKVAFVQSSSKGGDDHLLSSLYLAANEAMLARRSVPDLTAVIISPAATLLPPEEKKQLSAMDWLTVIEAEPTLVKANEENGLLSVVYQDKDPDANVDSIDLAVVLTQPQIPNDIKVLGDKLEQEVRP